jgi:uncharacterized protein HemY
MNERTRRFFSSRRRNKAMAAIRKELDELKAGKKNRRKRHLPSASERQIAYPAFAKTSPELHRL